MRIIGCNQGIIDTRLMPLFEDQYLSEITLAMAEQYKAQRLPLVNPATAHKELNGLKALLNKAVAWKHLKANPLQA